MKRTGQTTAVRVQSFPHGSLRISGRPLMPRTLADKTEMNLVIENLRLRDLVAIVRQNQGFYNEFVQFLSAHGYTGVHAFVREKEDSKAVHLLETYLTSHSRATLHDGLGRPYSDTIAKWYFLAWILRDAPAQRLGPLLRSVKRTQRCLPRPAQAPLGSRRKADGHLRCRPGGT